MEWSRAWSSFPVFPSDDGWPYPDLPGGADDPAADDEVDLDALELRADSHAFECLSPAEYELVARRYGLNGPPTSMKELSHELGWSRAQTRDVLGRAIDKLRARLSSDAL
jgi:DNA-directed RNA polymerase sigma subunit (sigma70/sigma32)